MKDLFGRDIHYLRVSVTPRCNLRCAYCVTDKISYSKDLLSFDELYDVIYAFSKLGIKKVRITGGEPLVREGILSFIERIASIKGIEDIAMTTNGILLKKYAKDLKNAGLQRLNISLDSLDKKKYAQITGGGNLPLVLEGIELARTYGLTPIKINTVLIKGFNEEEIKPFVKWTYETPIDVRFIELMPIGQGIQWTKDNFLSADEVLKKVPDLVEIRQQDPYSTATYYQLPEAKGRVGLIRPISCKFCQSCNRLRLTSEGKLYPCLLSENSLNVKTFIKRKDDLLVHLKEALLNKPESHHLESKASTSINMYRIGG